MNKTKVMQAVYEVADLQSICDKDIREKAINKVQKELESKPVMPKVFDEWVDYVDTSDEEVLADSFNTLLIWDLYRDEPEENLFEWITDDSKSSLERMLRLSKCIDAIRYGYEVEK